MIIQSLPAAAGFAWLRDGFRLFLRQPLGLPAMTVVYLTMIALPALLPLIGIALSAIISPFATVGLMLACREVAAGRPPLPTVFAQPFQDVPRRTALLRLGIVNAILWLIVAGLSSALGPEVKPMPENPTSIDDLPVDALLFQLLLASPLLVAMWFAPLLAGWHGLTPAKAMFGSAVACWRNLTPLLLFGLAAGALIIAASVLIVGVLSVLIPSRMALSFVVPPLALVLMAIVQASFLPMYETVFRPNPPASAPSVTPRDDAANDA